MIQSSNHDLSALDRIYARFIPERFLQSEQVFIAKVLWVYSIVLGLLGLAVLLALTLVEGGIVARRLVTMVLATMFLLTPFLMANSKSLSTVASYVLTVTILIVFYVDFNNQSIAGPSAILWIIPVLLAALYLPGRKVFWVVLLVVGLAGLNIYLLKMGYLPLSIVQPDNWQGVKLAYLIIVSVLVVICTWGISSLSNQHFMYLNQELMEKQNTIKQINELKQQAEASTHSKSMFLATMSHELRTPLNSVIGNAQLLSRANLPKKHHDQVNDIAIAGNLLLMLINDILDFSKLEKNELELIEEPYDLSKQINELSRILKPKLKTGVQLECELPEQAVYINGDQNRIAQIIMNILSNAIKFTDMGKIVISLNVIENNVHISILDTGIGIASEDIDKLFKEFSQVSHNSTRNMEGTGLGLAISMGLMNQMKGKIEVESEINQGSQFKIILPNCFILYGSNESNLESIEAPYHVDMDDFQVLIVDDIVMNCAVLEDMLLDLNVGKVISVNSGTHALKYLAENKQTHLVFMDMRMPEMDGTEATRLIRKMGYQGQIIAVTANASEEDKQQCIDSGMDGFISKPISMKTLERSLQTALERQRA